jgi:succinoglycan biosynthesis transport protein ExoP
LATVTSFPRREPEAAFEPTAFAPQPHDDGGFDLRRLFGAVRRRKILIAGLMIVATAFAAVYANQLQPLYSAETRLVIEGARNNVINIERVAQGIKPDFYTMETEAAVIGSRAIAAKVVDRLNLYDSPLYNPALMTPKPSLTLIVVDRLKRLVGFRTQDGAGARSKDPWEGLPPAEKRAAMREYLADAYLGGLGVLPSQTSRLITITYVSTDPEMAAKAANAAAEAYILDQIESKGDVTARASRWLNDRVIELRDRVIESETKLEQYRAKTGLIDSGQGSTLKAQLAKIDSEAIQARTQRAEAEARYEQVQKLLKDKSEGAGVESAAAVLDSPLIQRLREQETNIVRTLSALSTELREGHPKMVLAKNELADLRKKIEIEVGKIVRNLENEVEIARVRERNLKRETSLLESQIEEQGQAQANLRALVAEVDANKQLYQTVLSRFKETKVVDDEVQQADARIISPAKVPGGPFYPQKKLIIVAALFVSALFGIAIAIGLELLDNGFRNLNQIESYTGVPGLGVIPKLEKADAAMRPHEVAVRKPNSPFGESVRSIRTGLMLSNVDAPPRTVLVSSSVSSEGKTTTSLSVASLAARTGQRVIIVDCDLRHPSVHVALNVSNQAGLSNYLTGQCALDEVVDIDLTSGVHYITAGGRSPHPADLLGSQQMKALIALLAQQYDLVVLDTPPLLAVSDTLVLARQVEKAIFVVRWEKTRRETVMSGLRQILDAGADLAGIVLTQVDMKKQARYGQPDMGYQYYYDRHMKYYTE